MKEPIIKPRVTDKDILLLESFDQEHRRVVLCNTLNFVIKEEDIAISTYEDLNKSLATYLFKYDLDDIMKPIISDKNRHKKELFKLSSKMGCK